MGAQIGQELSDVRGIEGLGKAPRFVDQLPAPARLGAQPLRSSRSRHRVRLQRPEHRLVFEPRPDRRGQPDDR
jgi:hypothetical protein